MQPGLHAPPDICPHGRHMSKVTPVLLLILDGFGHRLEGDDNAILAANTPHWDALKARYPYGTIDASEHNVGLPGGQFGNSAAPCT